MLLNSLIHRSAFGLILLLSAACDAAPPVACRRVDQPAKTPCDVRGTLKNGGSEYDLYANPGVATSVNDCRSQCVRRGGGFKYANCEMFAFNATDKGCTLFNDDARRIIAPDSSSDTVFYSRKCFRCAAQACPSAPDPNTNLLDNAGFEDSDTLVGPWYVQLGDGGVVETEGIHPKQPGIKSRNAVHVKLDYYYDQDYRQCIGQTHRAEFDIYNVIFNPAFTPEFNVGSYSTGSFSTALTRPPSRPARRVVGFYTATDNFANIDMSALTFGSGGSFDFDNAVVRPVNYSLAKPIGDEAVINGGFEAGTAPWNYTAVDLDDKEVGKFSLVKPGLGGTPQALRWRQTKANQPVYTITLKPKLRIADVHLGKLHRLRFKTKPVVTLAYAFADGTLIYGSSAHDQYFYAELGMLPLALQVTNDNDDVSELVFDELSIREIEDLG